MDKYSDKKKHGKIRINKIAAFCFILIIFIMGFIAGRAGRTIAASSDEVLNGYSQMEETSPVDDSMVTSKDEPSSNITTPTTPPENTPKPTPSAAVSSPKPTDTPHKEPQKTQPPASVPANIVHNEWQLTLVNAKNPLPNDYSPKLKSLVNGLQFDERAIDQLNAMLSASRKQGLSPVVCSAYRSIKQQTTLFNNQVEKQISNGFSIEQANTEAKKVVTYPGTSEHNLGLAADIVSMSYQLLDDAQANTPELKWLVAHCHEYGFILRYPKDKTDITGIIYEPWHFRYVGVQAATEMMKSSLCLEEYLGKA